MRKSDGWKCECNFHNKAGPACLGCFELRPGKTGTTENKHKITLFLSIIGLEYYIMPVMTLWCNKIIAARNSGGILAEISRSTLLARLSRYELVHLIMIPMRS